MGVTSGLAFVRGLGTGRRKSAHRSAGDQARDRKDWDAAAIAYRRHLDMAPRDIAIWVQFGHTLKEMGRLADASVAYERARALRSRDRDLLLHLADCARRSGNERAVISYLQSAVKTEGDPRAVAELARMGIVPAAPRRPRRKRLPASLPRALTPRCKGLVPVGGVDVRLGKGGTLDLLSIDAWIEFGIDPALRRSGAICFLKIDFDGSAIEARAIGQLYVDCGSGYDERRSTRFEYVAGTAGILITDPASLKMIRWDPDERATALPLPRLALRPVTTPDDLAALLARHAPQDANLAEIYETFSRCLSDDVDANQLLSLPTLLSHAHDFGHDYDFWTKRHTLLSVNDRQTIAALTERFANHPTFSIVMPVYNTPPALLRSCLDAILAQSYPHFEICIADDRSTNPAIAELLRDYVARDSRVKVAFRPHNGHISAASNSALALATGDFVVLVDHDDLIPDYALFVTAHYINRHPDADILFSDEDKLSLIGERTEPYFKSDFNKYLMYGHNMVSHLGVYRRSLMNEVGGFRLGLEGSQDYDLFFRCYERSSDDRVVHIPHILYHWRMIPGSTAVAAHEKGYAILAAHQAINGHFERTGVPLRSAPGFAPGCTAVTPSCELDTPITIVIPTRDRHDLVAACLESILSRPHACIEIIIIDNGSSDPATLAYLAALDPACAFKLLRHDGVFNFSAINNFAVAHASGEILCFLNNDTEIVSVDWLNRARTFLGIAEIGAVGARLLFPDGTLQHLGIAVGLGDHGVAGTPHGGLPSTATGYFGKARLLQEVTAASAACLFVRRSVFDEVGGFEEQLPVAYNDVDLCLKIRKRGYRILADPDITVIHKESRSRGSDKHGPRADRLAADAAWMRRRWAAQLDSDPYFSPNLDPRRNDTALAMQPRIAWPWRQDASAADERDREPRPDLADS